MGVYVPDLVLPKSCIDCLFRTDTRDIYVGNGLYKKVSRCIFAPAEVEDTYRDLFAQSYGKETWCPLVEMEVNASNG